MKLAAALTLFAGLALAVALLVWQGLGDIAALLAVAGPWVPLVCLFHLLPITATALSWRILLSAGGLPGQSLVDLVWLRWLADAINALLPVAQIGGEVVRGQALVRRHPGAGALIGAGIIVDLTLGLITLVWFILGGLALAAARDSVTSLLPMIGGVMVFALALAMLHRLQRSGLLLKLAHFLERQSGGSERWRSLAGGAADLDRELAALYRRPGPLLAATGWRLAAWGLGALEMGLALAILGHPVSVLDMLILESVAQAFRNAGFAIPGALGIQEGGLILAGSLIGVPAEVALALALVKRVRDLALGVPALLVWQGLELRGLRNPASAPAPALAGATELDPGTPALDG
ncbi:Flippase-like domain-containing protein [uncultured Gammaproteobacteria bacterium]